MIHAYVAYMSLRWIMNIGQSVCVCVCVCVVCMYACVHV